MNESRTVGQVDFAIMPDRLSTLLFDCFNAHRGLDEWYAALADDFSAMYPGAKDLDKDQARSFNEAFPPAFSDLRFEYTASATNGDTSFTRCVATGTHDGTLTLGPHKVVEPTGKKITVPAVIVVTTRDGKIVREETHWNLVDLLEPLGLI